MAYWSCVVPGCDSKASKNMLYLFPSNIELAHTWACIITRKEWLVLSQADLEMKRICGKHFEDSCFEGPDKMILKKDAMPSLNLPYRRNNNNNNYSHGNNLQCSESALDNNYVAQTTARGVIISRTNAQNNNNNLSREKHLNRQQRTLTSLLHVGTRQSGPLNHILQISPSTTPTGTPSPNMPQQQGGVPRATVQPYNVDTRQLQTRSQAMYNQNAMYQQHAYPQYSQRGISPNPASIMNSTYPIHPDVEFKRLPFFDIVAELVKPSTLMPQSNARQQEYNFYFHLTPQQATDIASSRDVRQGMRAEYVKQIQMRFCLVETSCKQEDYFPPGLIVKVNNKQCPLPNPVPTNKPGVEPKRPPRPVNISQMIKLSPTTPNTINVQWIHDYGRAYAITIALVHKRNSFDLLQRMKARGPKHSDHTRGLIKEKLKEDADSEIATTSLRVSLMCPLGKMRMTNPCRAKTCQHLQSFDALLYLQMNERKPTWNCPVCDKPALYDDLDIDGYFMDVLNTPTLGSETKEIQLHKDGSWSTHTETKKPVVTKVQKVSTLDDSIEIISDDVEVVTPGNATSSTDLQNKEGALEIAPPNKSVVDLTLSDSDDDDQPLVKRRALNPKPDSTIKFSDTTSISSSSNQSRATVTPGPSSVSSSGYPVSPGGVITLVDSPSPPTSPIPATAQPTTSQPAACMMANSSTASQNQQQPVFNTGNSMPFLDLESEANGGANLNFYN